MRDPRFAARDSFAVSAPSVTWPEAPWRLRLRALKRPAGDCAPLREALADSAVPVRLRAMDLVDASCATDSALVRALRYAVNALPAQATRRAAGAPSWHLGAHAVVALARTGAPEALASMRTLARHAEWHVRAYAARAATVLADTVTLRHLADDPNDNVAEAAAEGLSKLGGHAFDAVYLVAIRRAGAQAVRAAAAALKGSSDPAAVRAASAAFDRWAAKGVASARDARLALLEAAGRPASDDRPPSHRRPLPPEAAELALGKAVTIRVTMAPTSGGGTFDVRVRGDLAPIMGARLLALVRQRYYDGLTWHRVEHDFVIQGGSPGANEYVGLDEFLVDELGTIAHPRGTVGMSTRGHDTGDAQWFVNLRDNARLLRDYTVWGEVVAGMEVVDGILEGDVIQRMVVLPAR
jgi:cyclophilin family peptidyl-prolyl cis-trans isomerase